MRTNQTIHLFNVTTSQDLDTGFRIHNVSNLTTILAEKKQVGVQTYWVANSNNIELSYTLQIQARSYANQKYVYFKENGKGRLFIIRATPPGSKEHLIKLNIQEINELGIKEVIENAL